MADYSIRVRDRVQSSPPAGQRSSWTEYQVVSGRRIVARLETMKQAEAAIADLIAAEPIKQQPVSTHDFDDCPNCGGEGYVASCFEEYACVDPESGCDQCMRRCDWCRP